MTVGRRDGGGTPFGDWLRNHPELEARTNDLSATDCDMWLHRYLLRDEVGRRSYPVDHIMLVEVKCFLADVPYSQADTLGVINLILRKATVRDGRRMPIEVADLRTGRIGVTRHVRWMGAHILQLSAESPEKSAVILWDGKYRMLESTLVEVLKFDRDPDFPRRKLDTRRHHVTPLKEVHPFLPLMGIVSRGRGDT